MTANYGTVTGKRRWCGGCAKGQAGAVIKTKPMKKKARKATLAEDEDGEFDDDEEGVFSDSGSVSSSSRSSAATPAGRGRQQGGAARTGVGARRPGRRPPSPAGPRPTSREIRR